jgi:aspartate aminotransferase-like enzyme
MGKPNIRITGPTPLPPPVIAACGLQMVSHRSQSFRERIHSVLARLQRLFETTVLPMLFTTSGTGGMEAAVVNTIEPGERILAIRAGFFGDRFAEIARSFGGEVTDWLIPWGQAIDPDELRKKLRAHTRFAAVLLTHNESSTGVLNPLEDLANVIRSESDALILVDGVSSVGATPVRLDEWGLDVIVTASQKALMSPPGLAIIAASARSLKRAARCRTRRYFLDFERMQTALQEGTTTYTPAIPAIYGLDAALALIEEEGLPSVFERHLRLSILCREGLREAGLECFVESHFASPSITAVLLPLGRSASEVRRQLEVEHDVLLSQGRAEWKERMLRVGHMGFVNDQEIKHLVAAVKQVLNQ